MVELRVVGNWKINSWINVDKKFQLVQDKKLKQVLKKKRGNLKIFKVEFLAKYFFYKILQKNLILL